VATAWLGTAVLGAVLVGGRCVTRAVVEGDSMRPTLEPGDRLVVLRSRRVLPGQLIVLTDPRRPERLLVKRVVSTEPTAVQVRGDNERASTDSREFGAVARSAIVGRVIYRYAPAGRTGPMGSA
jgi:nickel-type superoxide dismutase maturation protease